jgi:hypothetical protein
MDTLSNTSDTNYELPLSEADQTALRPALLHDLGALPFKPGAAISRSLWVIFIGNGESGLTRLCLSMTGSACQTRRTSPGCVT